MELYSRLYDFIYNCEIKANVCGEGKLKDVYVTNYKSIEGNKTYYPTIADAYDDFYTTKERNKAFNSKKKQLTDKINSLLKKLYKKLQGESEKILACQDAESL